MQCGFRNVVCRWLLSHLMEMFIALILLLFSLLEVGLWQITHLLDDVSKSREVTYEPDILDHKILIEFND